MRTLDIQEAAAMLKVHENTVMELVGNGELKGAKIGRAWVFIDEDIFAFVRQRIDMQSANRAVGRSGSTRKAA